MPRGRGYLNDREKQNVYALHAMGQRLHSTANELELTSWDGTYVVRWLRQAGTLVQKAADMMMAEVGDWSDIMRMARESARFKLEVVRR